MILRLYHRARQAKWASQHFRALQHAEPTPWGSCRSSRQRTVIPVSLFLVRHICYTATFFPTSRCFFARVWHILVVHLLYMPSSPSRCGSPWPVRPIKLVFTGSRDCVPVSSWGHPNTPSTWIKYGSDITHAELPGPDESSRGSWGCWVGVWSEWLFSEVSSCQETPQKGWVILPDTENSVMYHR